MKLWSHLETPLLLYPKKQFFINASFVNSNIHSYGALHRFSSLCLDEATGIILILARKFSHLSSADMIRIEIVLGR